MVPVAAAVLVFLVAGALYLWWHGVWARTGADLGDFKVYVAAGQAVLDADPLYEQGKAHLPTIAGTLKYPPFSAVVFVPLAWLPTQALPVFALGANVVLLLVVIWLGLRMTGRRRDRTTVAMAFLLGALCLAMQPVEWNLLWGNVNLVLMALVVVDTALPERSRWKGVPTGVAAGIKLLPLIFIAHLVLTGRWRAAGTSAVAFLVTVGLGFLVLPGESAYFWGAGVTDPDRVTGSGSADAPENQSIRGVVARLLGDPDLAAARWVPVAAVVGIAGLLLARRASRRGEDYLATALVGATMVLVAPVAWSHYWVWFVPFFVLGVQWAAASGRWWPWVPVVAGYLSVLAWPGGRNWDMPFPGLIFLPSHPADGPVAFALQNVEVVLGLVCLVVFDRPDPGRARPPFSRRLAARLRGTERVGGVKGSRGE
ncbi:glycosyltransferase 87 family protein [Saccharothrix australiensis]|nr:glycosyltransferase 87 family protein [Saccharothrix australiensis]